MLINPTSVLLQTVTGLPGDYNNDGTVDAADYTVWRDNLGAAAGTLPNDPNSGAIGADQYATWRVNYGSAASPTASAAEGVGVPEPTGVILLVLGMAALCFRCGYERNDPT
jgi:hypothetical protein